MFNSLKDFIDARSFAGQLLFAILCVLFLIAFWAVGSLIITLFATLTGVMCLAEALSTCMEAGLSALRVSVETYIACRLFAWLFFEERKGSGSHVDGHGHEVEEMKHEREL